MATLAKDLQQPSNKANSRRCPLARRESASDSYVKELMAKSQQLGEEHLGERQRSLQEQSPSLRQTRMSSSGMMRTSLSSFVSGGEKENHKDKMMPEDSQDMSWGTPLTEDMSHPSDTTNDQDFSYGSSSELGSMLSLNKVYGREAQEAQLLKALDRITNKDEPRRDLEMVLISGGNGTGKSHLAHGLASHVKSRGGCFCYGKFDQAQTEQSGPLDNIFSSYLEQLRGLGEEATQTVCQRIRNSVGAELEPLMHAFPLLRELMTRNQLLRNNETGVLPTEVTILDEDPQDCTRCYTLKKNNLVLLRKLIRAICSPERPVVMVVDDLQWATHCPLDKLRAMSSDDATAGFLLVGICRNNISQDHALSAWLRKLESEDNMKINNINVENLDRSSVYQILHDVLKLPTDQSESLADYIYSRSHGNPHYVVEWLRMWQSEATSLKYDESAKTWIQETTSSSSSSKRKLCCCPIHFKRQTLSTMPREYQKVVMTASCLGTESTERLLSVALQEDIADRLGVLVRKGRLTFVGSSKTYTFPSNSWQSACYDLVAEELKPAFHLEIGLRLWKHLEATELKDNLFLVLNQLQRGASLMKDQSMRYDVATLCIQGAEVAAANMSLPTASDHLEFAFSLLGPNHWAEAYELSHVLYNYAAEVEFSLCPENGHVDFLLEEVLANSRINNEFRCKDKIRAYCTKMYVHSARNELDTAIEIGLTVLRRLKINLKAKSMLSIALSMMKINRRLRGKSDGIIKRSPHMTDTMALSAMQVLNLLFMNTFIARRELWPAVVLKMMKLTMTHGISAISAVAFAGYGSLLCFAGKVEEACRVGNLALEMVNEFNAHSFKSRVGALVWGSIYGHVRPWEESLDHLKAGHLVGLQTGDFEFAMLNAHQYMLIMIERGLWRMSEVIARGEEFMELTRMQGHSAQLSVMKGFMASFKVFNTPNGDLLDHTGDLDEELAHAQSTNNHFAMAIMYLTKMYMYFVGGNVDAAVSVMDTMNARLVNISLSCGAVQETFRIYMEGLVCAAGARSIPSRKRQLLKKAEICAKLMKALAKYQPVLCEAKGVVLEAECAAVGGKSAKAAEKYDHAIMQAKKHSSSFEEATAYQVAASHFEAANDPTSACHYYKGAEQAYIAWGGLAASSRMAEKVEQMRWLSLSPQTPRLGRDNERLPQVHN